MTWRSSTAIADDGVGGDRLAPVHPGEILLEDFLKPMGISRYRLAKSLGVPPLRIHGLVHGRRAINADTALGLGRCVATDAEFWMNLQSSYDLEVGSDGLGARLEGEVEQLAS